MGRSMQHPAAARLAGVGQLGARVVAVARQADCAEERAVLAPLDRKHDALAAYSSGVSATARVLISSTIVG
ncbi:MAG: hypothetical protein ICV59_08935, partial [Thermoleophilia bacterium]|nr:hypothetical protein [Thermoleophilia bacterium]